MTAGTGVSINPGKPAIVTYRFTLPINKVITAIPEFDAAANTSLGLSTNFIRGNKIVFWGAEGALLVSLVN